MTQEEVFSFRSLRDGACTTVNIKVAHHCTVLTAQIDELVAEIKASGSVIIDVPFDSCVISLFLDFLQLFAFSRMDDTFEPAAAPSLQIPFFRWYHQRTGLRSDLVNDMHQEHVAQIVDPTFIEFLNFADYLGCALASEASAEYVANTLEHSSLSEILQFPTGVVDPEIHAWILQTENRLNAAL